jgi:ParB/RepB/Spo0J family partition protein
MGGAMKLKIKDIKIGPRIRQRIGNLESLVKSMSELGQLQPVLVSPLGTLIAGQRRIEAAKRLGWTDIEAVESDSLDDAVRKLKAERDENKERAALAPSEMAALAKELRALEKPEAKKRKLSGLKKGRSRSVTVTPRENIGKTTEKVALGVGTSASNLRKIEAVVEAAENDPDLVPVREKMDETGNVDAAYREVNGVAPMSLAALKGMLERIRERCDLACDGDDEKTIKKQHDAFGTAFNEEVKYHMNFNKPRVSGVNFYAR